MTNKNEENEEIIKRVAKGSKSALNVGSQKLYQSAKTRIYQIDQHFSKHARAGSVTKTYRKYWKYGSLRGYE